mmetsp:Transcript_25621/g.64301  ORF Transcript_25621/g.64301 Transcript_25621/m.64301 type:complete len:486 (-) Transcript_25621:75-1532(-)|eukprot:CAMPEP_0177679892 /NCGR_PEP_ID=MMETSP0447-20121125/29867_1 /TAXON_ID=0 /ORGANISM="Stygamoeba regulata, Strain BSH-02190019" /LENGTH=485 /DNA_ID=CAMNT_0019189157 /DNA_START=277 /DNA_END=1734 /DNA_ORIENTATION=-
MFARVLPSSARLAKVAVSRSTASLSLSSSAPLTASSALSATSYKAYSSSSSSNTPPEQHSSSLSPRWLLAGAALLASAATLYASCSREDTPAEEIESSRPLLAELFRADRQLALPSFRMAHAASSTDSAAEVTAASEALDWRERIRGNYNNRIRSLSTPEKVFSTFASVHVNGKDFMTLDDLCAALLPFDHRPESEIPSMKQQPPEFFKKIDIDKNGLIDFGEYLLFVTLLGIPRTDFKVAFRMFDKDLSGFIDRAELVELLQILRTKNPFAGKARDFFNPFHTGSDRNFTENAQNPPALKAFFGDNQYVTFEDFVRVFNDLHNAVLQLEFDRYDKGRTGFISARDFGLALIGYVNHKDIESYVARAHSLKNRGGGISFEQFKNFNLALEQIEEIATAIEMYSTSSDEFTKEDFARAVRAVANVTLSPLQVDVIFTVFDRDGDGALDFHELVTTLKARTEKGMSSPRDLGITRIFNCCLSCFSGR